MKRIRKNVRNYFPSLTAITDIPNTKKDLLLVLDRFNVVWTEEEINKWLEVKKTDFGTYSIHTVCFDFENKTIYNPNFNLDVNNTIDNNISFKKFKETFGNENMYQGYGITNIYDINDSVETKIEKCQLLFSLLGDQYFSNLTYNEIKNLVSLNSPEGNIFYSMNSASYYGFKYDSLQCMTYNKNKIISAKDFIKKVS